MVNQKLIRFQKGVIPDIALSRVPFPKPDYTRLERNEIDKAKERLKSDPLGDGLKLTVQEVQRLPTSIVLFVSDVSYSEILGVIHANPLSIIARRCDYLGIRPLVVRNFLISSDNLLLYSVLKNSEIRGSLNGYVDSDSILETPDKNAVVKTILKELQEEYAIDGTAKELSIHSIHFRRQTSDGFVSIFGTVLLPMSLSAILQKQKTAQDVHENPDLRFIPNVPDQIKAFATGAGRNVRTFLEVYLERCF